MVTTKPNFKKIHRRKRVKTSIYLLRWRHKNQKNIHLSTRCKHPLKKLGRAWRNIGKYITVHPNRTVSLSEFSFFITGMLYHKDAFLRPLLRFCGHLYQPVSILLLASAVSTSSKTLLAEQIDWMLSPGGNPGGGSTKSQTTCANTLWQHIAKLSSLLA